ncbi:tripartite tricarboxylate transporter permease [Salipiger sp. PrR002]|uniref:tripartite tricarboxylate transporter permease n=1 Tax=Salipiger sp. PrR002 TaxID=2706489 RepID=UPI0013BB692F|nr:tripartite tricarboxylate transporter permease [Salipiger sp. PrR002]NDW01888.1 tripartite tricarboxylate transporter permease [Salipiger sp. PrR002]NDW59082.1 tripartite tricarboxylate transporter permease [Salipiger sp. PrR004]
MIDNLLLGFQVALSAETLLYCFIGVSIGMFIGVLPGVGPLAAISMLLPMTYYVSPTSALVMLAGIYYGAQYGGSVASILLRLPGTASSAVICLDGYEMTKKGRAGSALMLSALASFIGGSIGIVLMAAFSPALSDLALQFGSQEYFMLMALGLVAASTLSEGSAIRGLAMVVVGVALGLVGIDLTSGAMRFTYGNFELMDGVSLVASAMGLFGLAEILANIGQGERAAPSSKITLRSMMPTRKELRDSFPAIWRGSAIGSFFGALPGTGSTIASFFSYATENRISRNRATMGQGAVEGVTGPEAANNSAAQTAFIPTLTLGVPGDAVMALLLGAMMVHGVTPGPQMLSQSPDMFWGLVASFWLGNLILLVFNIPMIGLWVAMLRIPYRLLYPAIVVLIVIGTYSIRYSIFDVYQLLAFGVLGFVLRVLRFPTAPLVLGLVLGPLMEENFRRSMMLSDGQFSTFLARPISCGLLIVIVLILAAQLIMALRAQRRSETDKETTTS